MNKIGSQELTFATVLSVVNIVSLYAQNGTEALHKTKCARATAADQAGEMQKQRMSDAEMSDTIANGKSQTPTRKERDFK